ncbi:jg17468 [Pararge aegeria aegeria]|uniref:GPI inositol-deacylase n=1 Tax=Pararge aegeria aegeria TaxID=348720 RepID=A0A8S4RL82_9NEOP|nr:jg17468 [Pararge aegeria aegeria]
MTYMFEYPQYVRLGVNISYKYPQYGLYAYSEGRYTERSRKMWFDGIPVLFLPGNSGSHMQVRSIASVALRKAVTQDYEYHFDYFTIGYNEELSGFYGGVLDTQTEFASACVSKILSLYRKINNPKTVPSSVILIGHSMGGLIAKRLLAYPSTINLTNIAITLAAPLEAPVVNFDKIINQYYMKTNMAWDEAINQHKEIKQRKLLISIGSGPRDILIPAGLTSSSDSHMSALTTSIPGVWVTPNHVSMVWCKQLVMVINRFLFDIIDPKKEQVTEDRSANRSMILNPQTTRNNVTMQADSFWYEDNRRIYQVTRPQIDRTTHLMIRLVSFPQNRFVAVETVNVHDKEWIFGCNAKDVHNSYRYCKEATSLSELSRWTGSAPEFGKRKLATVNLHKLMELEPNWTHVVVKVSPTNKAVVLNVDINDHASRQINVDVPSDFVLGKKIIKEQTENNSLYYELILNDFDAIHQAYLLYVEPSENCPAISYHVSAELHVPWAKNHEYYHYFTHIKKSPMKLRLFKSNPDVITSSELKAKAKVTLLLDPKCTFTISISTSWYHRLAQLSRNYTPVLFPYMVAILLLAIRSTILHVKEHGTCVSMHRALTSDGVKPYYAVVFGRFTTVALLSTPVISYILENASSKNFELQNFTRSMLVLPAYMTALGLLNIIALAVLIVLVFWSQLVHRILFRLVWFGGPDIAERMATGLQRVPMLTSASLVCAVPISCGAASLAGGTVFYAFLLSKMFEEYLEDFFYRLMSKVGSRICNMFKRKKATPKTNPATNITLSTEAATSGNLNENIAAPENDKAKKKNNVLRGPNDETDAGENTQETQALVTQEPEEIKEECDTQAAKDIENLSNIYFHLMLFFMWLVVTIANIPALLTWAHNFQHFFVLKPDTSYYTGIIMSACSAVIWQMDGPRKNLKYYDTVATLLFVMAVLTLALAPFTWFIINYGITFVFTIITIQQLYDFEVPTPGNITEEPVVGDAVENIDNTIPVNEEEVIVPNENSPSDTENDESSSNEEENEETCDIVNESRIYNLFKNLRERITFGENNQ